MAKLKFLKRKQVTTVSSQKKKTPCRPPPLPLAMVQDPSNNPPADESSVTSNESSSSDKNFSDKDSHDSKSEKLANIFDEKVEDIVPKRDGFIESTALTMEREDIYDTINNTYLDLNTRVGNKMKNELSDLPIQQSTSKPILIAGTSHQYTASMKSFCTQWILNADQSNILLDSRSQDIFTVPFKNIVCSHDRTFITNLSTERANLSTKDGNIHPYRYYVSFCSKISHQKNKFMRDIVVTFLTNYFETESSKMMKNDVSNKSKNMHAIVVFDRGSEMIPRLLDDSTICSVILFSLHKKRPIIFIDYV